MGTVRLLFYGGGVLLWVVSVLVSPLFGSVVGGGVLSLHVDMIIRIQSCMEYYLHKPIEPKLIS